MIIGSKPRQAFLSNCPGGIVFVRGYADSKGGVSDYWVNCRHNPEAIRARSRAVLDEVTIKRLVADCPALAGVEGVEARRIAGAALDALRASLTGPGASTPYVNLGGGLYLHPGKSKLYVRGLQQYKRVVFPATYEAVKSRPQTLVRRWVEAGLPSSRFRILGLTPDNFTGVSVAGFKLAPADFYPTITPARLQA